MSKNMRTFNKQKFLFQLPANLLLWFLIIIPTVLVIWFSFINYTPTKGIRLENASFIWLKNYKDVLSHGDFLMSLARTLLVMLVCVVVEVLLSLAISYLLSEKVPGKNVLFPIIIIPLMIAPVVCANNFWLLFSTNGPINQIISFFAGQELKIQWFSSPNLALVPIIASEIWHWFPLVFLIIYSGLAGVSTSEIRAATALGASEWQIFWGIKLPKMKKIIVIAVVIRCMEAIKVFDTVSLLTNGGPGTATETISYYLYKNGFWYSKISYISAAAWIVLIICMLIFTFALKSAFYGDQNVRKEKKA